MLQEKLITWTPVGPNTLAPAWLTERDDVWLGPLATALEQLGGLTTAEATAHLAATTLDIARRHHVSRRVVAGVWSVEKKRWTSAIDAGLPPSRIREVLFDLAATMDRHEAVTDASRRLGINPSMTERWLFSDRERHRRLEPPPEAASPSLLRAQYNLALAHSLLLRCAEMRATVRGSARALVRYTKARGLMAMFSVSGEDEQSVTAVISGPLFLFHETTKYARALAGLLPILAASDGWSVEARVVMDGRAHDLRFDAQSPLVFDAAPPNDAPTTLERRLHKDLQALGAPFYAIREPRTVRVGKRLFFPDLTLVSERGCVTVELVRWWTPEYIAEQLETLGVTGEPVILCVDRNHAPPAPPAKAPLPRVVTYDGRIDAAALVHAANEALASCRPPGS